MLGMKNDRSSIEKVFSFFLPIKDHYLLDTYLEKKNYGDIFRSCSPLFTFNGLHLIN